MKESGNIMDEAVQENLLIHFKLHSSTWDYTIRDKDFSLPMRVIIDRERENTELHRSRYGLTSRESFIIRKIKEQYVRNFTPNELFDQRLFDDWYSLHCEMTVLIDLDDVTFPSDVIDWHQYLAHDIRKYYVTGKISVSEQGLKAGYDVLFAFQCLDIPYDIREVSFDAFSTVIRSENRLAYYEYRDDIVHWISKRLKRPETTKNNNKNLMAFVTCPGPIVNDCQIFINDGEVKCEILSMATIFDDIDSKALVHNLFNEDHIETDPNYVFFLRKKFVSFLESRLSYISNVSFQTRKVLFIRDDHLKSFSSILPVLIVGTNSTNADLSNRSVSDPNTKSIPYGSSWFAMIDFWRSNRASSAVDVHNSNPFSCVVCNSSYDEDDDYDYDDEDTTTTTTSDSDDSFHQKSSAPRNMKSKKFIKTEMRRPCTTAPVEKIASNSTIDGMTARWLVSLCLE